MKAVNQSQHTYSAGNNRIDITTGNHPETLQPVYAVSIKSEESHIVEVGFGDISQAVQDTVNDLEIPHDQTITFPIFKSST